MPRDQKTILMNREHNNEQRHRAKQNKHRYILKQTTYCYYLTDVCSYWELRTETGLLNIRGQNSRRLYYYLPVWNIEMCVPRCNMCRVRKNMKTGETVCTMMTCKDCTISEARWRRHATAYWKIRGVQNRLCRTEQRKESLDHSFFLLFFDK